MYTTTREGKALLITLKRFEKKKVQNALGAQDVLVGTGIGCRVVLTGWVRLNRNRWNSKYLHFHSLRSKELRGASQDNSTFIGFKIASH